MTDLVKHTLRPTLRVSEVFYSIEGEGPFTGHPMIFVRTFGCNFTCKGFSNDTNEEVSTELSDKGCDSLYSWHPNYKSQTTTYSPNDLMSLILQKLPGHRWANRITGKKPILCFTGGEPMLQQIAIAYFIEQVNNTAEFEHILIETNCTMPVGEHLGRALNSWLRKPYNRITWANSPKLSNSGEPYYKALRPDAYSSQSLTNWIPTDLDYKVEQYLKFVSDGSSKSFDEIDHAVGLYLPSIQVANPNLIISRKTLDVYVMAQGATKEQQESLQRKVAEMCLKRGYIFCCRVHTLIWGNTKGT